MQQRRTMPGSPKLLCDPELPDKSAGFLKKAACKHERPELDKPDQRSVLRRPEKCGIPALPKSLSAEVLFLFTQTSTQLYFCSFSSHTRICCRPSVPYPRFWKSLLFLPHTQTRKIQKILLPNFNQPDHFTPLPCNRIYSFQNNTCRKTRLNYPLSKAGGIAAAIFSKRFPHRKAAFQTDTKKYTGLKTTINLKTKKP